MAAGRFVFPIAILGFLVFFSVWLSGHPAAPASPDRQLAALRVQPGDTVTVEYTLFYDPANGFAAFTTDEEAYGSGRLRASPFGIGFDARPQQVVIPTSTAEGGSSLDSALLGHHVNESFTSARFPNYFGAWAESRELPLTETLPINTTLHPGDPTAYGPFNLSSFLTIGGQRIGGGLYIGAPFPCAKCAAVAADPVAQSYTFARAITRAEDVAARDLLQFVGGTPEPQFDVHVAPRDAQTFAFTWKFAPGDNFVLGEDLGAWEAGPYHVRAVGTDKALVDRSPVNYQLPLPADLIGQTVWFDVLIVDIDRP